MFRRRLRKKYGRKKPVRTTRKRVYKRRSAIPRSIGPPKQMFAKLRWTYPYAVNIAASSYANREFRLNSLHDPDLTGTGDQPYYYDQYMAMFSRYRVYGVKMNVLIGCTMSASNVFYPLLNINSFADQTPAWNTNGQFSAKRSIRRFLVPGQAPVKLSAYYDLRSIAGVSKTEYNSAEVFQALLGANPSRPITLAINLANQDGSATIAYAFNLQLTFYCKFFDNYEPTGS